MTYYIEDALKQDLDKLKKLVFGKSDEDAVIVIDGRERSGKSVLGLQIAKYMDPSFELDSVCFTTYEFVKFIRDNKRRVCMFDETIVGMHSSRSMERRTIFVDELLAQSGQKNLIVILIIPFFFELTKRAAVGRSEFLIHVYRSDFKRGHYKVYDFRTKRKLFFLGKRLFEYKVKGVIPNYNGHFSNIYAIDERMYRLKKEQALNRFAKQFSELVEFYTAVRWVKLARLLEYDWLRKEGLLKRGAMAKRSEVARVKPGLLADQLNRAKKEVEDLMLEGIFSPIIPKYWDFSKFKHPQDVSSISGVISNTDGSEASESDTNE
ncbi:hypothetical protein LCGC14_0589130 [marine sediment metagenome]|uniref:Zona occludens toxin N-terminal domain-containing protein n=1 Tax=marine sediment metagenome TaxID=412755 RepID=A0A0F9U0B0_9ZZZZ